MTQDLDFYTNFSSNFDSVLISGYKNGKKVNISRRLSPYLFIQSGVETEYQTVNKKPVMKVPFESVKKAREFIEQYKYASNVQVYGMTQFDYVHVYENFKDMKYDTSAIRILNFDIETDSEDGYGDAQKADREVISVTVKMFGDDNVYLIGSKDYTPKVKQLIGSKYNIRYIQVKDEKELLRVFVKLWKKLEPDACTGWNIEKFDVQYIIKRIMQVLGDDAAKELSPFKKLRLQTIEVFNKPHDIYEIIGVPSLDYLDTYKKFSFGNEESYALDYIANKVLGVGKLDYSEYGSLAKLYKHNPSMFYDYNIVDVIRVEQINDVVKYLDIVFATAYQAKVNYKDTFGTIRTWDVLIHNYLMDRGYVVPSQTTNVKERMIAGGFVKEPILGKHKWLMSFDFKSLYPHLCMTFNISPERYLGKYGPIYGELSVMKILEGGLIPHVDKLKEKNVSMSGKGTLFDNSEIGFIPAIMEMLFNERAKYSKEEEKYTEELAKLDKEKADPDLIRELENLITEFGGKSLAQKILLNSGYGALSNEYMRWYSDDVAESITLSGQMAILWVQQHLNKWFNQIFKTEDVDYIVAIDTDSLYINVEAVIKKVFGDKEPSTTEALDVLEKFSDKVQDQIQIALEELYRQTNSFDKKLFMNIEAIGSAIWIAKKRYVMSLPSFKKVRFDPPKIKLQGIEAVRSSTPKVCREKLKDSVPVLINGTPQEVKDILDNFREEYINMKYEDIAFPRGVNNLEKYASNSTIYIKGTPAHVKGALMYNEYIKQLGLDNILPIINSGDKIRFVYMKQPNPIQEKVFAVPNEFPKELEPLLEFIDYDTMFEKTFKGPYERIVDVAGIILPNNVSMDLFFA